MSKHTLRYDGAPHNENSELVNEDKKVTAGAGRGLCSCGWLSDDLPSGRSRKLAFAVHKEQSAKEAHPSKGLSVAESAAQSIMDAIAEGSAALKAAAEAPRETKPVKSESMQDESYAYEAHGVVQFNLARHFFRAAGADGSLLLAQAYGVEARPRPGYIIEIAGDTGPVRKMAEDLPWVWLGAKEQFRVWKKTDEVYAQKDKKTSWGRAEAYEMEQRWFRGFMKGAADAIGDTVDTNGELIGSYGAGVMFIENGGLEKNEGEDLL